MYFYINSAPNTFNNLLYDSFKKSLYFQNLGVGVFFQDFKTCGTSPFAGLSVYEWKEWRER